MKRKKKPVSKHAPQLCPAPKQPKGKDMHFTIAKRVHLTGGGWAA